MSFLIGLSPVCSGYSQYFGVHLNDVLEFLSILFCIIGKQFYCTSLLLLLLLLLFLIYCFCNVLFLVVFFLFYSALKSCDWHMMTAFSNFKIVTNLHDPD